VSVTNKELVNTSLTSSLNLLTTPPSTASLPNTPPNKRRRQAILPYSPGDLGKWAHSEARALARLGWYAYFHSRQQPHSVHPSIRHIPHPTAQYLHRVACSGVPALSTTPPWSRAAKLQAIRRGPHVSASTRFASFLLADMYDYVQVGYWAVLPFHALQHYSQLKLSPAGVVPQRERRPRPIMDYTFSGVNQASVSLEPRHAMQFGTAFLRFIQRLVYCNPGGGPPLMAKIDLADGYYRVPLSPTAALNLAVVIPSDCPSPLVALPLSLPMGWTQSPPYFCAYTETVADIANTTAHTFPPHPLLGPSQLPEHHHMETQFHPNAVLLGDPTTPPLSYTDVYIDDFITTAQPPRHHTTLNNLLHAIDSVFHDHPRSNRKAVISAKKLRQGDVTWSTRKRILGWDVDTYNMSLQLPQHRLHNMVNLLTPLLTQRRSSRRKWQRLLGVLRSSSPALYGTVHLFSILQHALTKTSHRITLTPHITAVLQEWLNCATRAHHHPVSLHTLVPHPPTVAAATDASQQGMGGFYFPLHSGPPTLWRATFHREIQRNLLTTNNPTGSLTNSDLELAGAIVGMLLAAQHPATQTPHVLVASDNVPAVSWLQKGSNSSNSASAFLLYQLACHRRAQPFTYSTVFTAGLSNHLADCCSRFFHLSDAEFLAHMNQQFPVKPYWQLVTPPSAMLLNVTSALLRKQLQMPHPPPVQGLQTPPGSFGVLSVETSTSTPSSRNWKTPSHYYKSSHTDIGLARWLPVGLQSALERWKEPFVPWARRSPHWAAPTLASKTLAN
jgi:hypothetical protein